MSEQQKRKKEFLSRRIPKLLICILLTLLVLITHSAVIAEENDKIFPGADEKTPSLAFFFDWISSQYEGSNEQQTLIYLDFFKWLHDEYGMKLDIYSLDVGNIDDGPFCAGVGRLVPYQCGNLNSEDFKKQFPNGFGPLREKAESFGCRLGVWLGPDGFGDTPAEEKERSDMLIKLCRDYNFMLFKIDGCAGKLRPEKQDVLIRTIQECRKYCPDLIILNERVNFGKAEPYITTSLWEGAETYIDVFSNNTQTAIHHRAGALSRELVPGMNRLMEDHGVCFSSCLDYWEDDLILQTFNRSLIMAPEIYGNPWFLRDDEFPKLARIFNLHKRFGDILVNALVLPAEQYGPYAVSRGDGQTRFLTLRNLSWNPVIYKVKLDKSIGLDNSKKVDLIRFHPSERILGSYAWNSEVEIEVPPFRSYLLMATTKPCNEIGVTGCDYEIVRDIPGKPMKIKLLGLPGSEHTIKLLAGDRNFSKATLDGKLLNDIVKNKKVTVEFQGKSLQYQFHRKVADLQPCDIPDDSEGLYEATCFAADNNALEIRALQRSGSSVIPSVQEARKSFLTKPMFVNRAIWDRNLFDGDVNTFFIARLDQKALRLDFGEPLNLDRLVIKIRDRQERDINPQLHRFDEDAVAQISSDLKTWTTVKLGCRNYGTIALVDISPNLPVRYVRIHGAPQRIAEIEGFLKGKMLDCSKWRASNLFDSYIDKSATAAWSASFIPQEIPRNSTLAVAINGHHGNEGAYAALRVEGELYGAPDRSVSFPSNTWEYFNVEMDSNYTYYFPLHSSMAGKKIDIVVLVLDGGYNEIKPEAWLTTYPIPYENRELVLYEKK